MRFLILLLLAAPAVFAATPEQQAAHVLNRMAYGPRPGDIEKVVQMGVPAWIDHQLEPQSIALPDSLQARLNGLDAANRSMRESVATYAMLVRQVKDEAEDSKRERRQEVARQALQTAEARLARAIASPRQLEEVMVEFWFNHFNIYQAKGLDRALIADYEAHAIRPYVMGNFRQLLGATAKHPAMLFYLDNHLSSAEGSQVRGRSQGLNENYARELMELHTLGVDGGYTQQDVTELARMLTGWTFNQRNLIRDGQGFYFDPRRHDHGTKHWLGRTVQDSGQGEGEMALDVLTMHPSTARFLSYQLAQFFVADQPPPALVARLSQVYLENHGEIKPVLRALFHSAEFLAPETAGAKFKTPYQYVVSSLRAAGIDPRNVAPLTATLNQLGMPLYGCQTPDGYKNTEAAWLNPDALSRRIAFATALASGRLPLQSEPLAAPQARAALATQGKGAERAGAALERAADTGAQQMDAKATPAAAGLDADQLLAALGPLLSAQTRSQLALQPTALRAALALGSPDFMQR